MIWFIAWKNIWRNKLRSFLVIAAVALGIASGAYTAALSFGVATQKINASIGNEVSHIQLHHPGFLDNNDIDSYINEAAAITAKIRALPFVREVTDRTVIIGQVSSASSAAGAKINAIDPATEKKVTRIHNLLTDSSSSYFGDNSRNPLLISHKLADKLKARVHSKLILRFKDMNGNLVEGAFRVVGIYKTGNGIFDESQVFIRRNDLALLTGSAPPIHEIAVLLTSEDHLKATTHQLKKMFPSLSIMTWEQLQPDLAMLTGLLTASLYFILVIILLALAFGIVNTMLMVVVERIRELGMLMAIGMNRARIFRMIMIETILLSLTGGIVGMIFTLLLVALTQKTGIDLSAFTQGLESLGYSTIIYPENRPDFYFGTVILVVLTGLLSSLYPARKALSIRPADAVRSE